MRRVGGSPSAERLDDAPAQRRICELRQSALARDEHGGVVRGCREHPPQRLTADRRVRAIDRRERAAELEIVDRAIVEPRAAGRRLAQRALDIGEPARVRDLEVHARRT